MWPPGQIFMHKLNDRTQCFVDCIEAGDFMHVSNAVLVLMEILDVFPLASVNEVVGSNLDRVMQRLVQQQQKKREDLKILATSSVASFLFKRSRLTKVFVVTRQTSRNENLSGQCRRCLAQQRYIGHTFCSEFILIRYQASNSPTGRAAVPAAATQTGAEKARETGATAKSAVPSGPRVPPQPAQALERASTTKLSLDR